MLDCVEGSDPRVFRCLRECVLGKSFCDDVPTLCDSSVYLLREDDDLVLADRSFPVLTLEDESRLVPLRSSYLYKNVDFVVDVANVDTLSPFNLERLPEERRRRL